MHCRSWLKPITLKPIAPKPIALKPIAPKPIAPKPIAPKPIAVYLGLAVAIATPTLAIPAAIAQAQPFGREQSHCTANLTARDRQTQITLRSGPGTTYRSLGYGLVGDFVYLLTSVGPPEVDAQVDHQGNTWFRVGFPNSGAKGWIREDFLNRRCAYAD
jgi:hypothetical protein